MSRAIAPVCSAGILALCALVLLPMTSNLLAAEKVKAVVLVAKASIPGEYDYSILQKFKLNGQNEVRIAEGVAKSDAVVPKSEYKRYPKVRLEALNGLRVLNGVPTAYLQGDRQAACLPDDFDFGRNDFARVSEFLGRIFEGEGRDETPKGKKQLQLAGISRIYFVPESTPLDQVAFQNASEENTVEVWRGWFRAFPRSSKVQPAKTLFHKRLIEWAQATFEDARKGSYASIAKTTQILADAESVLPAMEATANLRADAQKLEAHIQSTITASQHLVEAKEFDRALESLQPIEMYRSGIPVLSELHQKALNGSNRVHREAAASLMNSGRLEDALKEYELALSRLPDSAATKAELDEVKIRIGLRDTNKLMTEKQYADALDSITALTKSYPSDPRLMELSGKVKRARAQELYVLSKPLYSIKPPVINSRDREKNHLDALKFLEQADALSADELIKKDLDVIRHRLAAYYMSLAQKAQAKPRGGGAAANYLYLARAGSLDSDKAELQDMLSQAREAFLQRSTIPVAVRVRNTARSQEAAEYASALEGDLAAAISTAQLPGLTMVDRDSFAGAQTDDEVLRRLTQGGPGPSIQRNAVSIFADVVVHSVRVQDQSFQRQSRYIANEYENPKWREYANQYDYYNGLYKECRKQYGDDNPNCQQLKRQRDYFNSQMNNVQQILQDVRAYSYNERRVNMDASMKVGYRFIDSLTAIRMTQQMLEDGDKASGIEISGAQDRDVNNIKDRALNLPDQYQFTTAIQNRLKSQLLSAAVNYCRGLSVKYYEKAEAAAAQSGDEEALENYVLYLYATPNKTGPEVGKAQSFISQKFNLSFDGNVR